MATLAFIGRLILGIYFLYSGINHFGQYRAMTGYAAFKKIPAPGVGVILSGLLMIYGGLTLILGIWMGSGILLLILALLAFTFGVHNFWTVSDPAARQGDQVNFTKNWALIGALLTMLHGGPTIWWL